MLKRLGARLSIFGQTSVAGGGLCENAGIRGRRTGVHRCGSPAAGREEVSDAMHKHA